MSPFAVKAIQLLLSLSLLIVLHELGHFIPAKLFKTRVEKFYLFFDVKFSLFKKKIGDTVYGIGWLPLGGYVKIAGMIDESMDKEQMAGPPQPWEFRSKPTWQRLIIMLGGVTVNIIVGFVIYICILFFHGRYVTTNEDIPAGMWVAETFQELGFEDGDHILNVNGEPMLNVTDVNMHLFLRGVETIEVEHKNGNVETINIPESIGMDMWKAGIMKPLLPKRIAVIDTVFPEFPAAKAGLLKGDKVLSVNDKPINDWNDFTSEVIKHKSIEVKVIVLRDSQSKEFTITTNEEGQIGVSNVAKELKIQETKVSYSFGESISAGVSFGYYKLRDYAAQFKYVFTKKGATQLGGFGAIANLFPGTWNWISFWETTALISIILAFMNILPIPALDGGHVMFLVYEMVTGRKPNDKFMEYAQMAGFFLLIALVLFANGNDIYRAIFK